MPSAFWSYRLKYVASVLNTGMDLEYSDTDIASFADAMMVSEEDQLLLGLPTEEALSPHRAMVLLRWNSCMVWRLSAMLPTN